MTSKKHILVIYLFFRVFVVVLFSCPQHLYSLRSLQHLYFSTGFITGIVVLRTNNKNYNNIIIIIINNVINNNANILTSRHTT